MAIDGNGQMFESFGLLKRKEKVCQYGSMHNVLWYGWWS